MKVRVLSAIVMLAIVIPVVIFGNIYFKILACILSMLGVYELCHIKSKEKKIPLLLRIISYISVGIIVYFSNDYSTSYTLDYKMIIGFLVLFLLPIVFINDNKKYNIEDAFFLIGSILFLGVAFNTMIIIRNYDILHFVYLAIITIITDTFAMCTGNLIGTHKLCEKISPNKTIEGSIGGSIVGTIIATLFYMFLIKENANIFAVISVTLLLSIVGQLGDLLFSSIKRNYGFKDFSKLIPGHGGILDRVDSMILVMITYILFMNIL